MRNRTWVAVLSEFFGGILMMLGLFTRPAALMNVMVTFTATFIYHDGDIGGAALTSFFFMIMCLCILLFGPGKYSLDHALYKQFSKRWKTVSVIVILIFSFSSTCVTATGHPIPEQLQIVVHDSSKVSFYLKNNTIIPKRVTLIIYQPHQEGNNTLVMWFLPLQKKRWNLPVGSSIYLASDSQVDRVMQGKRIDGDKPFAIVDKNIKSTTLKLKGR